MDDICSVTKHGAEMCMQSCGRLPYFKTQGLEKIREKQLA